jgi:homoserine O-acetyltransferase/O-succinyltransferase
MTERPIYTPRGATRGDATFYDAAHVRFHDLPGDFTLQSGARLPSAVLAYETYGELNRARDNAVLICHAFTGSSHAASHGDGDGYGWWESMFGDGRAFDTAEHFVICANVLGGCYGSTGPLSRDTATGSRYGARFPVLTIGDMVEAQVDLIAGLGIERLRAVIGGSMGGMQALELAIRHPEKVAACIPIACADRLSPDGIAYHHVGRWAIMADPAWRGGDYPPESPPLTGLAIARQLAHITYLNHEAMERKFARETIGNRGFGFSFDAEFEVEGYLRHQGEVFVERFDPNSYLYLSRAMDYFDLGADAPLEDTLGRIQARVLAVNYLTDGLFPIEDARRMLRALKRAGVDTTSVELPSPNGHDTFLIETDVLAPMVRDFIQHAPF